MDFIDLKTPCRRYRSEIDDRIRRVLEHSHSVQAGLKGEFHPQALGKAVA